ncbi:MAG: hypothetical protein JO210_17765 [Acidobacteriaceae bacterium]|nr:hypothetical protein [Acidobacteriaceae bacterium]
MQKAFNTFLNGALMLFAPFIFTTGSNAQIVNAIDANIPHSFVVPNKTLPPGKYTFRMNGSGTMMTVSSADGKDSDQFMVRQSQARSTPASTELVFNRYGTAEFLSKVYESGNAAGVAVSDVSSEEKQMRAQGKKPVTHTETGQ